MLQLSRLPWGLAAAVLAATWLPSARVAASPSVNVALKAAFPSPPYLVELLETAAADNATVYFALLDRIAKGHFSDAATDKALYEKFVEVLRDDGHMDAESLSTFKLGLSMRTAAPRVEAHYQYYATAVEPSLSGDQDGCVHWFLVDGKQYCKPTLDAAHGDVKGHSQARTLPFDRKLGSGSRDVILYADITSKDFGAYHETAVNLARQGEGSYRLRYRRSPAHPVEALSVSGYGVELTLKRTDYIVIDDRDTGAAGAPADEAQKPITSSDIVLDEEEEITDIKPLEKSELSLLGVKAASFIMQSESPFDTLLKLTQDFPKYSNSLGAHNVSAKFAAEYEENQKMLGPDGRNILWMNGVQLVDRQIQPFGLVDVLKRERKLIKGVLDLGLTGQQAVSLLGHTEVAQAKSGDEEPRRFDWRDRLEDGRVIIWLNNLEKDKRYADFSPHLWALIQHFGHGLPQVRKDIFNLVVPVDFSDPEDLKLITTQLLTFMKRLVPIRFGLVPLTPTEKAIDQAKVVYYLLENHGLAATVSYLEKSLENDKAARPDERIFNEAIKDRPLRPNATPLPFQDIFTSEAHEKQIHLAKRWVERLRADGDVPSIFFDGFPIPKDEHWLRGMNQKLMVDLQAVQQAAYFGAINETTWIPGYLLENAVSRRNTLIFPEDARDLTVLNVNKLYTEHRDVFDQVPVVEAEKQSTKEDWAALTVIADLDSAEGQKLLLYAIQFRKAHPGIRMEIVHNPGDVSRDASELTQRLKARVDKLLGADRLSDLEAILESGESKADPTYDAALAGFLAAANLKAGQNALMLNGRLVGPIPSAEHFKKEDFEQFLEAERSSRIIPVYKALEDLNLGDRVSGPVAAAKLTSATALSGMSDLPQGIFDSASPIRMTVFKELNSTYTSFEVGDASTATIFFAAVINPASEIGQKWAAMFKVLSELEGVHLQIFLNPAAELAELPVKRFYRYVLQSSPSFDEDGKVKALSANFASVPEDTLLVAGMDVPPAWLVTSKVSVDDLDNLRIKDIKARRGTAHVEAVYELENILIEGHSREVPSGQPPRGVQLVLSTEKDSHFADTIIMANIGYFQFKANPGVYSIRLKEGRSSDIFTLESVGPQGWHPVPGDETSEIALMDFQGATLYPRLKRKPGMEQEEVLGESKANATTAGAAMDFVSKGLRFAEGILGRGKAAAETKSASDTEHAEINIFSVASGHLYERMLNIMMVSVMRHTNHTVKFWFIEQFLSPSFKDFIPTLAAEYNFKYEMVTYKWPHWLRQQKEKQREIWGYKILFLDVLFPLSLDKVIFVDADQIVRTDMYDLVTLDLQGAPYGFTPMCDSRTEMEGFRFWKTGYWASYLKGRPYHISALYVVDLRRFRALAAGDRLRQQYHTLSADPQSLANLDQDLPNHMQFHIPIHSLPQEWLWCETWCSDETLAAARTIDLCNNPQTKEPKLDRARRQVPEWTEYDEEIAALARRRREELYQQQQQQREEQVVEKQEGRKKEEETVERNPKSRRFEDEEAAAGGRVRDEL
ncbi:glycosyltransferase family 24 protein [Thermothielavioides terrestris NRRL 8126]|uniref:Glycosyltransferase family 24 protein n=1 Tax=Thermothielavioides terrestris (strain ATCC 38088 / NRRL 8126) TaxID=578455 RepID=G2R6Q3_THETT|nr:glycosyltransferase family 24 protein [Thermothielavioides terrestris NRRL 8126]AEO67685.1 glycosyltransferase family 24 protein [Thermothielavioides terrestris NRRL 8126]